MLRHIDDQSFRTEIIDKRHPAVHLEHMKCPEIVCDDQVLGGVPVFRGTRVPIQSLFQHLEAGDSLADFLEGFPAVSREQIIIILKHAEKSVIDAA